MENPLLLELIATYLDTSTLKLFSKTPLWSSISPLFKDQHFWHRRAQALVNLDLSKYSTKNWHQVYNILAEVGNENLFEVGTAVLKKNKYNTVAVKILIALGHDPSVKRSKALFEASDYGDVELVQLLLADPRVDPTERAEFCLTVAAQRSDPEVLLTLLSDPRIAGNWEAIIHPNIEGSERDRQEEYILSLFLSGDIALTSTSNAITLAVEEDNPVLVRKLLQDYNADPNARGERPLTVAVEKSYFEVAEALLADPRTKITEDIIDSAVSSSEEEVTILRLLLQDPRTNLSYQEKFALLQEAAKYGKPQVVMLLLEDPELPAYNYALEVATRNNNIKVIHALVNDPRVDPSTNNDDLLRSMLDYRAYGNREILAKIVQDRRVDKTGEIVRDYLYKHYMHMGDDLILALLRSWNLDLSKISYVILSLLVYRISDNRDIKNRILEGIDLGGTYDNMESVFSLMSKGGLDSYDSLFRELLLKRLGIAYYLKYLQRETNQDVKEVISDAARSFRETGKVIHTSPMFTAYSGFILLAKTNDVEGILDLLEDEGASEEGLELAATLLGAYIGRQEKTRRWY